MTLKGHFDGKAVVLDDPVPDGVVAHTPVTVHFEPPERGSAEAILSTVGTWWMTPDETVEFLRDIEEQRNIPGSIREQSRAPTR